MSIKYLFLYLSIGVDIDAGMMEIIDADRARYIVVISGCVELGPLGAAKFDEVDFMSVIIKLSICFVME